MTISGLRLERRLEPGPLSHAVALTLALLAALGCSALLVVSADASVSESVRAFWDGAFGDRTAVGETLVQATPLILTGLAVVVAFRARVWNIGAEGQFVAGALGAVLVTISFPDLPRVAMIVAVVVAAMLAGAIWGLIPAVLKVRYGTNEVVVTVMMNFVMQYLLSYLLGNALRDPSSFYLQTGQIPEDAFFPRLLTPSRLHLGLILALIAMVLVFVLLRWTTLGYEVRAVGSSARVSRFRGIEVGFVVIAVMVIGGALAGLAGGGEVAGVHHRLRLDISTGYGFTAIIVALLARLNPVGVVVVAVAFGALVNGSTAIQIRTGVPSALVSAIQGLTLIFALMAEVLTRYQISRAERV